MIRDSYIYNGEVIHKRFKPKVHYFRYKVFSLLIDLDELNTLNDLIPYFSYNRFNIFIIIIVRFYELNFQFLAFILINK